MLLKKSLLALTTTIVLSGCNYFQFPGVHKVEVQQGNIVTQEMVDQLRPGMTKSQVRYVLGTPLVADTFNQDRWDYFYSRKVGSKLEERENVTVYFENEKLIKIGGDYQPSGASIAQ